MPDATYPFIFILVIDGEGRHAEQLRDARIDSAQYARVQLQSSIKVHGVSLYKGARRSRGNAKKKSSVRWLKRTPQCLELTHKLTDVARSCLCDHRLNSALTHYLGLRRRECDPGYVSRAGPNGPHKAH